MLFFNDIRRNAMKKFTTGLLAAAITAGVLGTTPAAAYDQGNFIVRAGAAGVYPTGESDPVRLESDGTNLGKVEADSAWSLGISFTYMATDNIGVGLLGAWPFEHDIEGSDGDIDGVDIGSTKHLPPTLTAQYHFDLANKKLHPFVGAGINYTYFFDEDSELSGTKDLDLENSWGWALEAGLDYELDNNWIVGAQVYYISIETEADIEANDGSKVVDGLDVDINPWVYMLSVGRKF
jgi:outer membrane protein